MKYLRLLYVSLLLSFAITGCNRRRAQVLPAPQPPPPIISTMPPLPPLTLRAVEVGKPPPAAPAIPVETPAPAPQKKRHRRRRPAHKSQAAPSSPAPANSSPENVDAPGATPVPESGASPIGQLSGEDTNSSPKQIEETRQLILDTEKRVKNLSNAQQQAHKDALAQVSSFLNQAKQALSMNDLTGAKTLANKANILVDELLK